MLTRPQGVHAVQTWLGAVLTALLLGSVGCGDGSLPKDDDEGLDEDQGAVDGDDDASDSSDGGDGDDGDDEDPADSPGGQRGDGGTSSPGNRDAGGGDDDGDDDDGDDDDADADDGGSEPDDDAATDDDDTDTPAQPGDLSVFKDPGTEPWQIVPEGEVAAKCKMDIAKLKELRVGSGFAVVRYGQLCYDSSGGRDTGSQMFSATKTLSALVTGIASYETREIERTGPMTGQLKDSDEALHWLSSVSYNREAHLAHVLSMVGHNRNLAYGSKVHSYDTIGSVQINTLSTVVRTAISQDSSRLGSSTGAFAQKFLFDAIGMKSSRWGGTQYATSWTATLQDMARMGLLIIHQGVWSGKRILDPGWTYKMTHPAFEDGNTAYGYLTWLVAKEGQRSIGGGSFTGGSDGLLADACSPSAVWQRYPHGLSEATDCTYKNTPCEQKFDVGSWSAQGLGGQFVVGHPGLDLVLVAKNYSGGGGPAGIWDAVRPALVAMDETYEGDDAAFCKAYGAGDYAPDLPAPVVQPDE